MYMYVHIHFILVQVSLFLRYRKPLEYNLNEQPEQV